MGVYGSEVLCGEACEVKLEQIWWYYYFLSNVNFRGGRRDRATESGISVCPSEPLLHPRQVRYPDGR